MPDTATKLLDARDLTVVLPGDSGDVRVLDAVSVSLDRGEVLDVAGPSGAGKTTLLRAIARLLPDTSGSLSLDGVSHEEISPEVWRAQVALLPQRPVIVGGDVAANLMLPWRLKVRGGEGQPTAEHLRMALSSVAMSDVALERDACRLSVGQQARIALLRVLLSRPRVLLLDEPDAALDPASAEVLAQTLREFAHEGGGVIRSRHRGSDGLAARRIRLEGGSVHEEVAT